MDVRPAALMKRIVIVVHRWLGVALAAVFLLWFVSGIVMMYRTFPTITARDRLERAPTLRPERIQVSVQEAYAALEQEGLPDGVHLASLDGRPVYRFSWGSVGVPPGGGADGPMVYADDGTVVGWADEALAQRAAARWAGRPVTEATRTSLADIDQWTIGRRDVASLDKYVWPDGQHVYVNRDSGEVSQYTTTASRFWAYVGAIPHWLYFTPLRRHQPEWLTLVVWSSSIGTVSVLLGMVIGVWMYSPRRRYRHAGVPSAVPYRGWKRLHTIVGLIFGVTATTWTFSGLLSMGPFPIVDRLIDLTTPAVSSPSPARGSGGGGGAPGRGSRAALAAALRGTGPLPLEAFAARDAQAALRLLAGFDVRELEFTAFDGEPMYVATNGKGETRVVPVRGAPQHSLPIPRVVQVVRRAMNGRLADLHVLHEYDAYYLDRRGERPLPVILARLDDPLASRYYIDPKTATIVGTYNARGWVNRWLYRGLHSLDFPWLYTRRPLWDIVVITLLLGGTALCVTSLVLAWRVIGRKLAALTRRGRPPLAREEPA